MASGFQEGILQTISSVYVMLGNIRSHDQAQGQCGKELHKGVDTGGCRSREATMGHRDVFAQMLTSISVMHGNVIMQHS